MKTINPKTTLILVKPGSLIVRAFFISLGLLMSLNVFAVSIDNHNPFIYFPFATKAELQKEITNRKTGDSNLQNQINNINNLLPLSHAIGDQYQGGIIFWLDDTGQHGLIAASADQSTGIQWYNGTYRVTGATGDGIGAGRRNTDLIIAAQIGDNPVGNFAAKVAADYKIRDDGTSPCTGSASETCYGDWYLPSDEELNLLYQVRDSVGGFADDYYWGSTELDSNDAWYQYFFDGLQSLDNKSGTLRVRAVRAF